MPTNVALLRDELRYLTINPDKHNQGLWAVAETSGETPDYAPRPSACGSFGCLAGNTAIHSGAELDWYKSAVIRRNGQPIVVWQADDILDEYITTEDRDGQQYREQKPIRVKAMELLDLTYCQAEKLFDGDNTQERLWQIAEEITAGEITSDPEDWHSDYAKALRDAEQGKKGKKEEAR